MTAPVLDHTRDPSDDGGPSGWPVPDREAERVAALHELGVLDRPRQDDLDAVARLVADVCGTPFAVVNLIDADRQWQAAAAGTEPAECSRADALCAHTVTRAEVFWTPMRATSRTSPTARSSPGRAARSGSTPPRRW